MNPPEAPAPPVIPPPRRSRGLWTKLILGGVVLVILMVVALVVSLNSIVRRIALAQIERATGLKTEIDSLKLSLRPPGVSIKGFRLINNPAYGGGTFLDLPELAVSVDRSNPREGQIKLFDFRLDLARVNVVVDKAGKSNLDVLQQRTELERKRQALKRGTNAPPQRAPAELAGIDRFVLSVGEIHFEDQRDPNATKTLRFGWTNEVMTNIVSREDLGGRLLALSVTRGATMDGEKVNDFFSLLNLVGALLKPSGN